MKALTSLILFYWDHVKDIVTFKVMHHVDQQIINADDDPKTEFDSVGGLNLKILSYYLILIFVFSEVMIYLHVIKRRKHFFDIFKIPEKQKVARLLVMMFPIHFTILKTMVVNIKSDHVKYKISNLLITQSENMADENKTATSVLELSDEYDSLSRQLYHLNNLESEILLLEVSLEQEPQISLQGVLFLLTKDFKRLGLLFDQTLGLDLRLIIGFTWVIQLLSIIRAYQRVIHRKRFPMAPGLVGTFLQTIATGCLLAPKLMVVSMALLNTVYIYPLVHLAIMFLNLIIIRNVLKKQPTMFDVLAISTAPVYCKLEDRNPGGDNASLSQPCYRSATALMHLLTLIVYFVVGWIFRQTVFLYNLPLTTGNHDDSSSFLRKILTKERLFPSSWIFIISIYIGSLVVYHVAIGMYYSTSHPWSKGREKDCKCAK